jgi:hypothetical protein
VGVVPFRSRDEKKTPVDHDRDPEETPETPLDEPRPPRIQDPPPEPGPEGPYVA